MNDRVTITETTLDDIRELAQIMREPDRAEIYAATGQEPLPVLEASMRSSTLVWTGRVNGELLCVFGIGTVTLLSGVGVPWLLGSPAIEKYSKTFMKQTILYMKKMKLLCPMMVNFVDARNKKSIIWLRRLGFTILDAHPWGVAGLPFHRFEMRT